MKNRILLVALPLVAIVLLSGCVANEGKKAEFTYGEPTTIAAAPMIIAGEKGFWKAEGLDVRVQRFSAGRLALDATISGGIQANSVSETGPILAIMNGNKIVIIGTANKNKEAKFIGRKDKGILEPKDLKGKKVATLPGTDSDYFLYNFLKANGTSPHEVQIIPMQPPEMISALAKGDIDGFFAWEPHVYYARGALGDNAITFDAGSLYTGYHTIIMRRDFAESNPVQVEQFLRGISRAEEFIKTNRAESVKIVAKHLGMKEEDANILFPEYEFALKLEPELLEILNSEANWAIENKIVSSAEAPDFSNYILTGPLRSADPLAVSIK